MRLRFQWLLNLTSCRSSHEGYMKLPSEKKKEKKEVATPVELVTIHVEERPKRYDLPLEIGKTFIFKRFLIEHKDDIVHKRKLRLYCSIDDFENMLTLARDEATKRLLTWAETTKITLHVGRRPKRYDLPLEIRESYTYKLFMKMHKDDVIVLKKDLSLYCSIDDFEDMLVVARDEVIKRRALFFH